MSMWKRTAISSVLAATLLVAFWWMGLLDLRLLAQALGTWQVRLALGLNLALLPLAGLRYFLVVRKCGLEISLRDAVWVSIVALAVGQWLPGTAAVVEGVRASLILCTEEARRTSPLARVFRAAVFDRIAGLAAFFVLGGLAFLMLVPADTTRVALLGAACCFVMSGLLLWLPRFWHERKGRGVVEWSWAQFPISFLMALVTAWAFALACEAVGTPVAPALVAGVLPILTLASMLPLGIGGVGGYQGIAAAVFAFFGLSAERMASASLLHGLLALVAPTVLAAVVLAFSWRRALAMAGVARTLLRRH